MKKTKKGMGLIAALFFIVGMALFGVTGAHLITYESDIAVQTFEAQQAFYVADGGMQFLMEVLSSDDDWTDNADSDYQDISLGAGLFSVHYVEQTSNTATVEITARVGNSIRRVGRKLSKTLGAFQYTAFSGDGGIDLHHTDGTVYGNIGSEGTIRIGDMEVTGNIAPDLPFSTPEVDFGYYYDNTDPTQRVDGNKVFTAGTYSGLWYVRGNVTIESGTTIEGTVVATGNIHMTNMGNIVIESTMPNPGIIAGGNILGNNSENITIDYLIYAGNNLTLNNAEGIELTGTVIGAHKIIFHNGDNIIFNFDESILNYPPHGFNGDTIIVSSEWYES